LNILIVAEHFYPHGGAELSLWQLVNALAKRGYRISVVTSQKDKTAKHEVVNGIEIYRPFRSGNSMIRRAFFAAYLYNYLDKFLKDKDREIDLLYNLAYVSTLPSTFAAAKYGIPVITYIGLLCGRVWFELANPISAFFSYLMEILTIRFGKHNVLQFQCEDTRKRAARHTRTKTAVISNIFTDAAEIEAIKKNVSSERMREALNIGKEELFLLFAGPLLPVKNIVGLIEVLSRLELKFRLVLVGEGPERSRIEKLVKENGLEGKVTLLGQKTHLETLSLMRACDVLIHPSKSETGPAVVIEALALEKPVIATRVGVTPEVKSANLYLVNHLDEVNQLLRKGVTAKKANDILPQYSLNKLVTDYENLFAGLVKKNKE